MHAVSHNLCRRILAWTADAKLAPASTCSIFVAGEESGARTEGDRRVRGWGRENLHSEVDHLFDVQPLPRVLAQVDVSYSNSLIEAGSQSLRHQWLYLNSLDTLATVRRLVGCYHVRVQRSPPASPVRRAEAGRYLLRPWGRCPREAGTAAAGSPTETTRKESPGGVPLLSTYRSREPGAKRDCASRNCIENVHKSRPPSCAAARTEDGCRPWSNRTSWAEPCCREEKSDASPNE